jgi:hypothetical protein
MQSYVASDDKRQCQKISILKNAAERTSNLAYLLPIRLQYSHNTVQLRRQDLFISLLQLSIRSNEWVSLKAIQQLNWVRSPAS